MLGSGAGGEKPIKEAERLRARKAKLERVSSELTKHKNADEELYKAQADWEKTFDAISDWIVLIDLKGRILRTNRSGEDFTSISSAQIVGQSCCKLVHGSDNHVPGCPLQKMLHTRQRESAELKVPDTNRWLLVTIDPVTDKEGNLVGAVHITRDITNNKKVEEALKRERDFAENLFKTTQAIVLLLDREGRIKHFNPYMEQISGYRLEEVKGRDWFTTFLPKHDQKRIRELFFRAGSGIQTRGNVNPIVTKDGCEREVEWYDKIIKDANGNVVGLLATGQDITERKKAEEALRESEERYRNLFENAGEGIITLDLDGRITAANRLVEEYGFNRDDLIGRRLFEFVPEYDRARSVSDFQALLAGSRVQGQMDVITPKGIISVEYRDTSIVRAGEIIGVQAILTDITDRKKAENEKDELLRTIETAKEAMCIISPSLIITYTNEAMDELFGYKKGELIGKHVSTCNAGATPEAVAREIGNSIEREGRWEGEVHNIRKDGTEFISYATTSAHRDKDGKIISFLSTQHDITQRKKAEQRLKESEERFRKIVDTAPGYLLITDQDGKNLYVGPHCEKITGYSQNELIGQIIWWVHEDDTSRAKEVFQSAYRDGRPGRNFEYKAVKKNGQVWHASTSWEPIKDSKGQLKSVVVQTFDITERKRAEEAYRTLVDHSLQGLSILQDGHVVFANQALAEITGYTIDELLAMSPKQVQAFIHPEDRPLVWSRYRDRLNGEEVPERYEFRGIRKDGSTCWLELHANRVEYQGKPAIQTAYVDITERKRVEEALRESGEKFRSIFDNANDIIASVTKTGKILEVNKKIEDILGYKPDELIGKNFMTLGLLAAKNAAKMFHIFKESVKIGGFLVSRDGRNVTEVWVNHKDGHTVLLEANSTTIKEDGKLVGYLSVIRDITERKLAEEAYRSLVDHSLQGLSILQDGRVVFANQALAEITGYTIDELLAMSPEQVQAFIHPEDRPLVWSRYRDRLNGEEVPERYEFRGIRKDGSTCWLELHANRIEYNGKPAIQTAYVDITERKKAEEVIAKLAKFPDEDPYPVLRISGHGTVIYANTASLPLLKVWRCRVGQSLRDRWHELVMDSLSSGQSQQTEVKCDGRIFSLTFAPVVDANYVNVYGLDITERKRAEEGLRSSRDYLKKLTDSMWDAVFSVKMPERVIEWVNNSFRLIGYEPVECIGKTTEFLYPDESEFLDFGNKLKGAIAAEKDVLHAEQILRRKNGETFPAEITTTFFREKGEIVRLTSIVRDVSERKKAEEELIEHQAKLKAMASKILMTEERERQHLAVGLHDEVCQKLVLTKLALESSLNLVSDSKVLASLRIACGAIGETIEQADSLTFELSNPILRQLGFVIALEKYLTEEIQQRHGIAFELESDEQLGIMQDEIKNCLFRVTRELLTNVVKHAHARKVTVSVRETQSQIYVRVQDDGVGFKESQAGAKVSQTARFGLFSIREQLEYFGGHLEIESKPGQGTTATVVVPLRGKAVV